MNQQIQELRGQVKLDIDQYQESLLKLGAFVLADDGGNEVLNAYLAKFAELIVRECAEMVRIQNEQFMQNESHYGVVSTDVLKHFGVEE